MRVLVVGMGWLADQPGGLNRYVGGLVESLEEARGLVLGPATGAPGRVLAVSSTRAPLPRRLLALRRAARTLAGEADVVDAHFPLTALPVLGPLRGKPLVAHFHGPWDEEAAVEGAPAPVVALKRALTGRLLRRARVVVALSEAFAELAAARYGVDPERIEVVAPGVDLERFGPGDRAAARRRLGLDDDAFVAVSVRRLVPRMGLDVLLDAWPAVGAARPGARLLVAGDGPERERLERGAPESVAFLGRVGEEELLDLYRAADVSVVPSRALEGFGLVVAESLACGTPAVVSAVGGLPEAVAAADPTLAVPAGDPGALAARLLAPLPDRARCRAAAERLSWERCAARHLALYARAARPRVVFLDHTARLSGGELALARLLPELDVTAHVLLGEDGPLADRLRGAGIAVEVLPFAAASRSRHALRSPLDVLRTLGYALRVARRLRALDADVVYANSLKSGLYGGVAARLARVPLVWHVRDRIAADYLPRRGVALVRTALRILPAAVIANSRATAETLPGEAAVVPSPVAAGDRPRERNGRLRVGMVGRIAPWKGQHVFVEAFARAFGDGDAVARIVGAPLFGAGEEEYARDVAALAARLGVGDRVELVGFSDDVPQELARLDLLVHASTLPEPFGQVVAEGMAAGLPVVAAAAGGPAEFVEDGTTGLLYPPGDVEALAAALRRLAADEGLRESLGAAARERAAAFAPAEVAARVDAVIGSVR